MRRRALLCALLGLGLGLGGPGRAGDEALLPGLKAAYLYNFTRFITWPEAALGEHFRILVLGDPALAAALVSLERPGKQVQGRPFQVTGRARADGAVADCELLVIGAAAAAQWPALAPGLTGRPVLVVGDDPALAGQGVAISFFLRPDVLGQGHRLRFIIDPGALRGSGLKVSAQLYDAGEVLR